MEDDMGIVVEDESAAVEVNYERDFFRGRWVREEEAEGGVVGGVERYVFGERE